MARSEYIYILLRHDHFDGWIGGYTVKRELLRDLYWVTGKYRVVRLRDGRTGGVDITEQIKKELAEYEPVRLRRNKPR